MTRSDMSFDDVASDVLDMITPEIEAENLAEISGEIPAEFRPTFWEVCRKCGGTGRHRSTMMGGICFACNGAGGHTRKTSPEARAKARASSAARKVRTAAANWQQFGEFYPDVAAWIDASPDFEFARSLKAAVEKYGDLTEKQLAAANKCVAARKVRDERIAADRAAREAAAPVVSTDKVRAAFDKAAESGIRRPILRLGSFVFKPASAGGKNPGAIYAIRKGDDAYLGKIVDGKFYASRDCDDTTREDVAAAVNDPEAAAIAYGKRFGQCAICGRELSNAASIERGIGPICAENFGW